MSFCASIQTLRRGGREYTRVGFPLAVLDGQEERSHPFLFDTGCAMTTVSEDVAALLGLPAGGTSIGVGAAIGSARGRIVDVDFRFPPDAISEAEDDPDSARWIVVDGRRGVALLCFLDVHRRFTISADDDTMYFASRPLDPEE